MVIEFGRWRLVSVDSLNWELAHLHVATKGKNAGQEQWNRLRRYYSYNTLPLAIRYAADCEMKEQGGDTVVTLADALHEYERIVGAMASDVIAAVTGGGR